MNSRTRSKTCSNFKRKTPEWRQVTLQTHHVYSMLKRREKDRFHIVLTWNTRGVFVVNCVFMSSDVVLVTFFVNFGYISRLFLLFLLRIRLFHYKLALNFSYRSQGTTIHCKSLTPRNKQNHIEWFWQHFFNWKRLWMSDLIVLNIICFQTQK